MTATTPKTKHTQDTIIKLRRLAPSDLDTVVAIDASIGGRSRRKYFESRLALALAEPAQHVQFGVEENGELAGYVLARVLEGEFGRVEPSLRLEIIEVKPKAQHHGIGHMLHTALEDEARKRRVPSIRTGASWRDHRMLGFMDEMGYALAPVHIIECRVDGALGTRREESVEVPERDRPADRNDYGAQHHNDFEALARDTADVRSLTAADLAQITRIDRRITGRDRSAYMKRALDEALGQSAVRVSLVAKKDGVVAGFVMAKTDFGDFGRPEPVAVIDTIDVDPDFAHQGIGHALLSQLFINLAALRVERVETLVAKENFDLLGFFYGLGFNEGQRLAFVKRVE